MAKRLNPKRRKELWERRMMALTRPSALTTEGTMRSNSGQWGRDNRGSSKGLARGLLHQEQNAPTYSQPKRRKATGKAVHVNEADMAFMPAPGLIPHRDVAPKPLPKRTRRAGGKVVVVNPGRERSSVQLTEREVQATGVEVIHTDSRRRKLQQTWANGRPINKKGD